MLDAPTTTEPHALPWIDLGVVAAYLIATVTMGVYLIRKNQNTEDYFLGGRAFPGWAVGLSMLSTSISSITFIALPAAAFVRDYRLIVPNLMYPVAALLAILIFIPLFRRGRITTAFEYLEQRFGPGVRLYAAAIFLITQVIRVATVLYLVAIPVSIITNVPVLWVVVIGGLFICLYTIAGGFAAVIWTDVAQTVILLGGGIIAVTIILLRLPEGLWDVIHIGTVHNKFSVGELHWSLSERTVYTMIILGLVNFCSSLVSDQNMVQRYLAASSDREAKKATILSAAMSIPVWLFFFFFGTCLFAFYELFPDPVAGGMNGEEAVSYFLKLQIPVGLTGLIVAGCLAAAMSTLDSAMNAFSAVAVTDIIRRHTHPDREERFYFRAARACSASVGAMMIGGAVILHFVPRESMANLGLIAGSLFGGALLSIYLVGFFVPRADNRIILIALACSIAANVYLTLNEFGLLPPSLSLTIHAFWTRTIVNLVILAVSLPLAWLVGPRRWPMPGLTFQSIRENPSRLQRPRPTPESAVS